MGSFGSALRSGVVLGAVEEEEGADLELSLLSREPIAALLAGGRELQCRLRVVLLSLPGGRKSRPSRDRRLLARPAAARGLSVERRRTERPSLTDALPRATRRCRGSTSPEGETRTLHPHSEFRKVQLENNHCRPDNSIWPPSWNLNKPQSRPLTTISY